MKKIKEISFFKSLSLIGSLILTVFLLITIIIPNKASANDPEVSITVTPSSIPLDTKTNVKITWTMSGFDFSDGDSCTLTMPEGGIYSRTNDGSMMEPITFNSSDSSRVYSIKCYKKGKRYSASASVGATCVTPAQVFSCPAIVPDGMEKCVGTGKELTSAINSYSAVTTCPTGLSLASSCSAVCDTENGYKKNGSVCTDSLYPLVRKLDIGITNNTGPDGTDFYMTMDYSIPVRPKTSQDFDFVLKSNLGQCGWTGTFNGKTVSLDYKNPIVTFKAPSTPGKYQMDIRWTVFTWPECGSPLEWPTIYIDVF